MASLRQELEKEIGRSLATDLLKRVEDAEAQRDSLRSQIEAEVERMRSEAGDPRLNLFTSNQAKIDANRLQAILDSQEQVSGVLSQEVESNRPPACAPPTSFEGSAVGGEGK